MRTPCKILLVEDSPTDAFLTKEAIDSSIPDCQVDLVCGFGPALRDVRNQNNEDRQNYDLVLFGLNPFRAETPGIIAEFGKQCQAACIPLIVLASSPVEVEVLQAFAAEANRVLLKPVQADSFACCVAQAQREVKLLCNL